MKSIIFVLTFLSACEYGPETSEPSPAHVEPVLSDAALMSDTDRLDTQQPDTFDAWQFDADKCNGNTCTCPSGDGGEKCVLMVGIWNNCLPGYPGPVDWSRCVVTPNYSK